MFRPYSDSQLSNTASRIRLVICCLYIVSGIAYFSWRLTVFNEEAMMFSAVFYLAELYGFLMSFLIIVIAWKVNVRTPDRPPTGLSVDVFITTYDEPVHVIRRALVGAMNIRYPHETWILDDGNRSELKQLADELGSQYLAREINTGAKAGNLNNGLKHAQGDFVAIFDADHVADIDFLDKTLGYFNDPDLAFVQTPQDYYNMDSFQHGRKKNNNLIWHEQSYFHYIGQPGRDYWNATTLCGCSAVMRRSALDEIGGFPEDTVTEDMQCSVKLQKKGFKTAFHTEPLAFGLAPVDLRGFLRQRLRWGEGNMQVCREEGLPFSREITPAQRFCYFALTSTYLDGWQKLVYYIAPIYVLFTQVPPIWTNLFLFSLFFIPYFLLSLLYYEETGRGYGRILATEKYAMARFAIAIIATLGVFRKRIGFRVTSKDLKGEFPFFLVLPQLTIFILGSLALLYTVSRPILGIELYMPDGITLLLGLWTLINTTIAAFVIKDVFRSSTMKHSDYSFEVPLPVQFRLTEHDTATGLIESVNSERFTFTTRFPVVFKPEHWISGKIFLQDRVVRFRASLITLKQVRPENDGRPYTRLECSFDWEDAGDRDGLEASLISCKWHRMILKQHENVATPFETLTGLFHGETGSRDPVSVRIPVLYRESSSTHADYELGYIAKAPSIDDLSVFTAFKPLQSGQEYDCILCYQQDIKFYRIQPVSGFPGSCFENSDLDSLYIGEFLVQSRNYSSILRQHRNYMTHT